MKDNAILLYQRNDLTLRICPAKDKDNNDCYVVMTVDGRVLAIREGCLEAIGFCDTYSVKDHNPFGW